MGAVACVLKVTDKDTHCGVSTRREDWIYALIVGRVADGIGIRDAGDQQSVPVIHKIGGWCGACGQVRVAVKRKILEQLMLVGHFLVRLMKDFAWDYIDYAPTICNVSQGYAQISAQPHALIVNLPPCCRNLLVASLNWRYSFLKSG